MLVTFTKNYFKNYSRTKVKKWESLWDTWCFVFNVLSYGIVEGNITVNITYKIHF